MDHKINIVYFGQIAEGTGKQSEMIEAKELHNKSVREFLNQQYPGIDQYAFTIAVDNKISEICDPENTREIAVLPPFAGG